MQFISRKKRQAPAVILVSLIDVLIVLLIFLMVSTTFKQYPALKLSLPESKQTTPGAGEANLVVTIAPTAPHLYLGSRPLTAEKLEQELIASVAENPQVSLAIRADADAPFGQIVKVMDAAKAAKIRTLTAYIKPLTNREQP